MIGAATSQVADNLVVNTQTQSGTINSNQTLDVVAVSDVTSGVTTATGNSVVAAAQSGSLDVQSAQSMQADALAATTVNVSVDAGQTVSLTTAATGNAGEADSVGGGAMTANVRQDTSTALIGANSAFEAGSAQAGDVSASATAIANTQGLGAVGATEDATVAQTTSAAVEADGGGNLQYTAGTASLSALAVGNNITATGTDGSSQTLSVVQGVTSDHVQATHVVNMGNAQTVSTGATATANNLSVSNDGGPLNVVTVQDNQAFILGQAETTAYEFGSATSSALGVGNSVSLAETGDAVFIDNVQTNSGNGVEVIASASGTDGYDLSASATAMGNSVLAFSCSVCGGRITARNQQVNSSEVDAITATSVGSSARSVTGVATAIGNSATFYVSSPGS